MGLGEQCPDTVGAEGLLPHCVSLGERLLPCTPPGGHCILDVVVQGDGPGPLGDLRPELCVNKELRKDGTS